MILVALILCMSHMADTTPTLKTGIVLPVPRLDKPNPFGWSTEMPTIVYERKFIPHPDTKWLGWPVTGAPYSGIDPAFYMGGPPPDISTHPEYEIGLDPSGIVVWRRKP